MAEILRTRNLTKRYKHKTALDGLSISLEEGRVYGLIGCDGAGKTTLLRILAGLSEPTEGSVSLFGGETPGELCRARKRVGFLIDRPAAVEYFTIRKNLELQARLLGGVDGAKQKELRRRLELTERKVGRRRYDDCALWERQRYGIAAALLGEPELLVLDEPMNGLDPEGVRAARALLEERNRREGVTMLIASAQPEELRGLATDYLFLGEGRLLAKLTGEELEARLETEGPEAVEGLFSPEGAGKGGEKT